MMEQVTLYVVVDNHEGRHIHTVCESVEEAEAIRQEIRETFESLEATGLCMTELAIHAMHAAFPGDRFRLVYGTPEELPVHPLEVPKFCVSRVTYTDAHSEGYLYPDDLFVHRKEALAAAARHNTKQLQKVRMGSNESMDWGVVVEIGEPLWRRYRSECMLRHNVGWEDTDLVRPVRVIHPTDEESAAGIRD